MGSAVGFLVGIAACGVLASDAAIDCMSLPLVLSAQGVLRGVQEDGAIGVNLKLCNNWGELSQGPVSIQYSVQTFFGPKTDRLLY
ncbi:MAG: hypothetical protein Tsb002_12940 [Wenzhouxiangellaceae bacterium]